MPVAQAWDSMKLKRSPLSRRPSSSRWMTAPMVPTRQKRTKRTET